MFKGFYKNRQGSALVAELLIAALVLVIAGFAGLRMHRIESLKAPVCKDKSCFVQKFASCERAAFTDKSNSDGEIYAEIYGKNDIGCKMTMRYITSTNPDWTGKALTCNFDNSKSFEESVRSTIQEVVFGQDTSCEGTFLQALKMLSTQH